MADEYLSFIQWVGNASSNPCKKWNIPCSVQIAQAILESGWGTSIIGQYNIFGITGSDIYINDRGWADFESLEDACEAQARLIGRADGYYTSATALLPDKIAYIEAMSEIYAPSSDGNEGYADKIILLCNNWDLWKWDDPSLAGKKVAAAIHNKLQTPKPSDSGFQSKSRPHGKHADTTLTKLPKGKTFCEPTYPDLVTISDHVPEWLIDKATIPYEKMELGNLLMYKIPTSVLKQACGGELDAILGTVEESKTRQRSFDFKTCKNEQKNPNPGKPANNNDPFPVDLKIEELEMHKPRVKINSITCCPEAVPVAKATMVAADATEKRLVRLENIMSTMLRYLFRSAARMQINCVYYGGQTSLQKYKNIRCLHSDRLRDGQFMSLDQCLNCTRYEPIIGQIYEIVNQDGINLASILDDNQMALMTMDDYETFSRTGEHPNPMTRAELEPGAVDVRNSLEKDFTDDWPDGVKMKWDLVPMEEQAPHINWRQSVIDDGSDLEKLSSYPNDEKNNGRPPTLHAGSSNIMQQNAAAMDNSNNASLRLPISEGKRSPSLLTDEFLNTIKGGLEQEIKKQLVDIFNVDPVAIAAILAVEHSVDAAAVIQKYRETAVKLNTHNPAIVIAAYKTGTDVFTGREKGSLLPRIDRVKKPGQEDSTSVSQVRNETAADKNFGLRWEEREAWLWTSFAEPLMINLQADASCSAGSAAAAFFPSVCYLYLELQKSMRSCRFDGDRFAFPFMEDQLSGVWFTSPFGYRESTNTKHCGIDLATGPEGAGMKIHAIESGVVLAAGAEGYEDWNGVVIQHADGFYSRYFHNSVVYVAVGQSVRRGEVISAVGDVGSPGAYHLHVEIGEGTPQSSNSQDPLIYWPLLSTKLGDGGPPLADR